MQALLLALSWRYLFNLFCFSKQFFQVRILADSNLKPTKEIFATEERDLDEMVKTFTPGKVLGRFEWEREGVKKEAHFYAFSTKAVSNLSPAVGNSIVTLTLNPKNNN